MSGDGAGRIAIHILRGGVAHQEINLQLSKVADHQVRASSKTTARLKARAGHLAVQCADRLRHPQATGAADQYEGYTYDVAPRNCERVLLLVHHVRAGASRGTSTAVAEGEAPPGRRGPQGLRTFIFCSATCPQGGAVGGGPDVARPSRRQPASPQPLETPGGSGYLQFQEFGRSPFLLFEFVVAGSGI